MKQDIRTSWLAEIFLYIFATVKVFLTFLETMMRYRRLFLVTSRKIWKTEFQTAQDIFVIEEQYLQWKPHRNRIKWPKVTGNWRNSNFPPYDHIWSNLCSFVLSPLRIHSLISRLNTPKVSSYMVIWREIWISSITCNFRPFYPILMGFSPKIIEFYAKNYDRILATFFLNLFSVAKFGHHIWRHKSSHMGWN